MGSVKTKKLYGDNSYSGQLARGWKSVPVAEVGGRVGKSGISCGVRMLLMEVYTRICCY